MSKKREIEARQLNLVRGLEGKKCERCGERRKLSLEVDEAEVPYGGTDATPREGKLCVPCWQEDYLESLPAEREKRVKLAEERAKLKKPKREPEDKPRRAKGPPRRLTSGGEKTLDMVKRLLQEGRDRKAVREVFRAIYKEKGRTDEAWVRSRVEKYLYAPEIVEFRKTLDVDPIKKLKVK